jgi:uncharacterized delta-60 repeat protein
MRAAALVVLLLSALAFGAGVARAEGGPDPAFGDGGRLLLPSHLEEGPGPTLLADGRVIFASYKGLLALLPTGEVDTGFGEGGRASPLLPPGANDAALAALLVDSRGGLLLVGGCTYPPTGGKPGESFRSEILVERFSADGQLDRSFGAGRGFATTDLGLPPPESSNATRIQVRSAALDAAGRILLSGDRATGTYFYKGFQLERREGFVGRLDAEGDPDRSFAGSGVVALPGTEGVGLPAADPRGGLYVTSGSALAHFRLDGSPDPGFGENGWRRLPRDAGAGTIVDPSGRIFLYGYLQGWKEHRLANGVLVKRLLPSGDLDRSFGRDGAIRFRLPRLYTARIGLDSQGRVLVAAALKRRHEVGRRPAVPPALALARLRPNGRTDGSFGRDGVVRIPFPGGGEMNISSLQLLGEEALLGATWCNGGCGEALARVDLGR